MLSIKVKCFNQYTNENVCKHFEWHEESGRLCEVEDEAIRRAVELCQKHGLIVLGLE